MANTLERRQKTYLGWLFFFLLFPAALSSGLLFWYYCDLEAVIAVFSGGNVKDYLVLAGSVLALGMVLYVAGSICWSKYLLAVWEEIFPKSPNWWRRMAYLKVVPVIGQIIWLLFVLTAAGQRGARCVIAVLTVIAGIVFCCILPLCRFPWGGGVCGIVMSVVFVALLIAYKTLSPGPMPKWSRNLSLFFGVVMLAAIVAGAVQVYRVDRQYDVLRAELLELGVPGSWAELQQWYDRGEPANADSQTFLGRETAPVMVLPEELRGKWYQEYSVQDQETLQRLLSPRQSWFDRVDGELAEGDLLKFERDYEADRFLMQWPELAYWKELSYFYELRTVAAVNERDAAKALRLYRLGDKILYSLTDDVSLPAGLVADEVENNRLEVLVYWLGSGAFEEETLSDLAAVLDREEEMCRQSLFRGITASAMEWMALMQLVVDGTGPDPRREYENADLSTFKYFPQAMMYYLVRRDTVSLMRYFAELLRYRTASNPYPAISRIFFRSRGNPPSGIFNAMLQSNLERIFSRKIEIIARIRLAKVALRIERFRLQHGRLPVDLAELEEPDLPRDPFHDEMFHYIAGRLQFCRADGWRVGCEADGYRLYSVGANLADDGGRKGNWSESDLCFEVFADPLVLPEENPSGYPFRGLPPELEAELEKEQRLPEDGR